jgi:predicted component of type VI protein secretion system
VKISPRRRLRGREGRGIDVWIPQKTIAARHAVIEFRDGVFYLRDLRSTNGTRINDRPRFSSRDEIREVALRHRDRIIFDEFTFEFMIAGQEDLSVTEFMGGGSSMTLVRPTDSGSTTGERDVADAESPRRAANYTDDADDPTKMKPTYCQRHRTVRTSETCAECGTAMCRLCMKTEDRQRTHRDCPRAAA